MNRFYRSIAIIAPTNRCIKEQPASAWHRFHLDESDTYRMSTKEREGWIDELMVVDVGEMTNVRLSTLFWILASQQQAISTFLSIPLQTNNLGGVSAFLNWPPRSPMKLTLLCAEEKQIQIQKILGWVKNWPRLVQKRGGQSATYWKPGGRVSKWRGMALLLPLTAAVKISFKSTQYHRKFWRSAPSHVRKAL